MTLKYALTTILGGFLFAFFIQVIWDRLVLKLGSIGGFLAAMLIPGTMWVLNHGINNHLIIQSNNIWIDMSWAAAISGILITKSAGKSILKSLPNIFYAVTGGILAGVFINFLNF